MPSFDTMPSSPVFLWYVHRVYDPRVLFFHSTRALFNQGSQRVRCFSGTPPTVTMDRRRYWTPEGLGGRVFVTASALLMLDTFIKFGSNRSVSESGHVSSAMPSFDTMTSLPAFSWCYAHCVYDPPMPFFQTARTLFTQRPGLDAAVTKTATPVTH
ncbi:hypothetical protein A0H81_06756 [Grifola frondosa]|uniref:Uncharacterized protein n=1 Tax=Grifola frondosa TaxID=5627 RepID=A0A1C7M958_GRIFR|nr:hypothetical protein A0H81_06756 [Grifola frondosa]